jgi:hypothetical protein
LVTLKRGGAYHQDAPVSKRVAIAVKANARPEEETRRGVERRRRVERNAGWWKEDVGPDQPGHHFLNGDAHPATQVEP